MRVVSLRRWLLTGAMSMVLALHASVAGAQPAGKTGRAERPGHASPMPAGGESSLRIAAISGVHEPHQGFALSATVPSDRMCLELAQNLASELGIMVHVVCTDALDGRSRVVAECGYANDPKPERVGSYSHGWGSSNLPYLVCVPPPPDRFRARRVTPVVEALRPEPRSAP